MQSMLLSRKVAVPKNGGSLGVEHASDEAIIEALKSRNTCSS